jgi:hypothetical protein
MTIGRSRGWGTTKTEALTDRFCRLITFLLTGGHMADCVAAEGMTVMPSAEKSRRAAPDIPPKANRHWKYCFSPRLYRNRNAIERHDFLGTNRASRNVRCSVTIRSTHSLDPKYTRLR